MTGVSPAQELPCWEEAPSKGETSLPRNRGLGSIFQLIEETKAERVRANRELANPSTREIGELRMQLARDRQKFLDLLRRRHDFDKT